MEMCRVTHWDEFGNKRRNPLLHYTHTHTHTNIYIYIYIYIYNIYSMTSYCLYGDNTSRTQVESKFVPTPKLAASCHYYSMNNAM